MNNQKSEIRKSEIRKMFIVLFGIAVMLSSCAPKNEKPLETGKIVRGNISAELPTTGTVIPRNRLAIKPPVAGRIDQVLVVEGQKISKGKVLAWMSSTERAAILDAARSKGPEEMNYWQNVYRPAPIIAPIDGFLIKRSMEPGQSFSLNDEVLVMADRLIVEAQIDETDIGKIMIGQKAKIVLDAYPGQIIPGHVEHIAYESQTINNVTVYKVNVLPNAVPGFFRSGMSATINFLVGEKQDVLVLPLTAVKKKGESSYAFVKGENQKVKAKQVQTGLENSHLVEIISGLKENDVVIIPNKKILSETLDKPRVRPGINIFGKKKS